MTRLPDPQQPTAPQAGQPLTHADQQRIDRIAEAFSAALDEATATPTAYRDHTPVPAIGTAQPVPQPGIPPMSQRATDIGRLIMYGSWATVPPGLIAIGIMVASERANPTIIGMICAAPAVLAVPILAIARLLRGAREVVAAAPPEIHQHYSGYVDQRSTHQNTQTRGVIAVTKNTPELPR